MDFKRAHRVGQLIQQAIARLLIDGLKDPRVGFCTVTEVRVTDDLKAAKVFVSVYGTDAQRAETIAGLEASAGYIKREVAREVKLRFVPTLSFHHDDSLDRAERLEEVFAAIHQGETEAPQHHDHELAPVHTARSDLEAVRESLTPPEPKPEDKPRRRGRRNKRRKYS